jgi:hypothetical protein
MPPVKLGDKISANELILKGEPLLAFERRKSRNLFPQLHWGHFECRSINELNFRFEVLNLGLL